MASFRHVRLSALRAGWSSTPKVKPNFQKIIQRGYSTKPSQGHSPLLWIGMYIYKPIFSQFLIIGCISFGAAANHYYEKHYKTTEKKEEKSGLDHKKEIDYQAVYNDIADLLESDPE